MNNLKSMNLLLVEDSENDIDLFKYCLNKNKIHVNLTVIDNGDDAIDYVKELSQDGQNAFPDLVLLDINLPGANGIEILKEIKENEVTKTIPVVMLTSSKHDEDIIKSYSNHANCFLQKPIDLSSFQKVVTMFEEFWFTVVTLPTSNLN
ncbi:MAG: response regulator [Chlamydiota bacterium]|nr:response regulator [Chlamydiota bacterium]